MCGADAGTIASSDRNALSIDIFIPVPVACQWWALSTSIDAL
jgi:hypothetical protein